MKCLNVLTYFHVGIKVVEQDVVAEDTGDVDEELEAAKLAGKKKKSKKNKKKINYDEEILMEAPKADGLYF